MNQPMFLLSNVDIKEWKSILKNSHFASPFQTPEFLKVLKVTERMNGEVYALAVNGIIKVLAVVTFMKEPGVKGFFSRRGIIFGGPLIMEATKRELKFFLHKLCDQLKNKVIYVETRNYFDYSLYKKAFNESKWELKPYLNVQTIINNIDKEKVINFFRPSRRREIRQSYNHGASYKTCTSSEEILEVYKILNDLYKEKVKLPIPAAEFFLNLFKYNIITAFIVEHQGQIIGGAFCPLLPGKAIYTYYYCGLRDYHKKIFPAHMAVLAVIEYAAENNIPIVDFMGAGEPNIDYGVRNYKLGFGGDLLEHGRFIRIFNPALFKIGEIGVNILKRTT